MKIYVSSGIRTHTTPVHDRKVSALDRSATLVRYQMEHLKSNSILKWICDNTCMESVMVWYQMQSSVNNYYTSFNLQSDKKWKFCLTFSSNIHVIIFKLTRVVTCQFFKICIPLSCKTLNHWSPCMKPSWPSGLRRRLSCRGLAWCVFESRWRHIFSFWIFRSLLNGADANEIQHVHSPEVIVVLKTPDTINRTRLCIFIPAVKL